MNDNKTLILCRPLLAPIIYDFLRTEAFDEHVQLNDLILKYLQIGIEKDNLTNFKKYENDGEYPHYKTVYLTEEIYDFIKEKSNNTQVGTSVLLINYLMLGINEEKGKISKPLQQWFNSLKNVG